jgi:hypothetical protein
MDGCFFTDKEMWKTDEAFDWTAERWVAWCDHPFRESVSHIWGSVGRTLESSVIVMILSNNSEFYYSADPIMQSQQRLLQKSAVFSGSFQTSVG